MPLYPPRYPAPDRRTDRMGRRRKGTCAAAGDLRHTLSRVQSGGWTVGHQVHQRRRCSRRSHSGWRRPLLPNIDDDMKRRNITLRQMCHVNENGEGDSFVGVKADTDGMTIYFPIGYELPEDDDDLRVDVHNLFGVLAAFMKEDSHIESPNFSGPVSVDFPMHAYIQVIRNFLNTGHYYIETEAQYTTATKGTPHWPRTFKDQMGLVQKNGSIIFTEMTVRKQTPNANKKITQIHQYCVHEAFSKMGAIYVSFVPEEPAQHPSITESISILTDKINHTAVVCGGRLCISELVAGKSVFPLGGKVISAAGHPGGRLRRQPGGDRIRMNVLGLLGCFPFLCKNPCSNNTQLLESKICREWDFTLTSLTSATRQPVKGGVQSSAWE